MRGPVKWLAPWSGVDDEAERRELETELRREMCETHVLAATTFTLLARRRDMDEALYLLPDGRIAEVHLTWASHQESDPRWPATVIYASLKDWAERSMVPTHAEFPDDD